MSNTSNYANQASTIGVPTIRTTTTTNNTGGNFLISNPHGNHWGHINQSEVFRINQTEPQLEVKGKMTLNGRDLEERLETIEKVLQIPERDLEIEKQYPKLKKMYNDYIKELSKLRMWEELKK